MKKAIKIKEKVDNWITLSYKENRVYDALASLLDFESPCCAVKQIPTSQTLYVSYNQLLNTSPNNSTIPRDLFTAVQKHQRNLILDFIENPDNPQKLLCLYLLFSNNFNNFIKNQIGQMNNIPTDRLNKNDQQLSHLLKQYRKEFPVIKTNIQKDKNLAQFNIEKYYTINNVYLPILDHLRDSTLPIEIKEQLFRPYQDSIKLTYWAKSEKNTITDIQKLSNPEGIHTEYNILHQLPKEAYTGISLLCCGLCDEYLGQTNPHRGTHGTCDPDWKVHSADEEQLKNTAMENHQNIPDGTIIFSERRLSCDQIETTMYFDDNSLNLQEFKNNLGLSGDEALLNNS